MNRYRNATVPRCAFYATLLWFLAPGTASAISVGYLTHNSAGKDFDAAIALHEEQSGISFVREIVDFEQFAGGKVPVPSGTSVTVAPGVDLAYTGRSKAEIANQKPFSIGNTDKRRSRGEGKGVESTMFRMPGRTLHGPDEVLLSFDETILGDVFGVRVDVIDWYGNPATITAIGDDGILGSFSLEQYNFQPFFTYRPGIIDFASPIRHLLLTFSKAVPSDGIFLDNIHILSSGGSGGGGGDGGTEVPEPASLLLLGTSLAALGLKKRNRSDQHTLAT